MPVDAIALLIQQNDIAELANSTDLHPLLSSSDLKYNYSILVWKKIICDHGVTTLHISALYDSLECYVYIEQNFYKDKKFEEIVDADSNTPLYNALFAKSHEVAAYILSRYPEEAARITNGTHQYLWCAIRQNSTEMVRLLIKNGAQVSDPRNQIDELYFIICANKNMEILRLILNSVPTYNDQSSLLINALSHQIYSAIPLILENENNVKYVSKAGQTAFTVCLDVIKNQSMAKLILDKIQGNPDIPGGYKADPLVHYLAKCEWLDFVEIVLKRGVNVNRLGRHGRIGASSILFVKDPQQQISMMKLLLKYGYSINLRGRDGNTLLGLCLKAIKINHDLIDFLISQGADINLPFINNRTIPMPIKNKIIELASLDTKFLPIYQKYIFDSSQ